MSEIIDRVAAEMTPNHPVPGLRFYPWLNKPMNAIRQATILANLKRKT